MGFLLINKPVGWTSHDVVAKLRSILKEKKIGHAGTLDPFATGVLIVGVGKDATKRLDEFKSLPKTYQTQIILGAHSTTGDPEGEINQIPPPENIPTKQEVENVLQHFLGKQTQTPPMFSAKKVGGKKLYELARKGKEIEREPQEIEIFDITLLDYTWPKLTIKVSVSTGTYIRTLAEDIAKKLGTQGYCSSLERVAIGPHTVQQCTQIAEVTDQIDMLAL